jgi:hypothetical protein
MSLAVGGVGALNTAVPFVDVMSSGTNVVGDGVTDDAAAIQKVINNNPGRTIYFPRRVQGFGRDVSGNAIASYYLGSTLTLSVAGTKLLGDSGPDGAGTALKFAPRTTGVIMDGPGQVVEGLALLGSEPWSAANYWEAVIPAGRYAGVTVAAGASDADGIRVRHPTSVVRNCLVTFFGRDGLNASASDQSLPSGVGAEDCEFTTLFLGNNRGHGLRIEGGDSNQSQCNSSQFYVNQFCGVDNEPFLGGTFVAPQATENGIDDSERLNGAGDTIADIASLARSGNTVTLTWAAPYTVPTLAPGNGVRVITCPDASFVGRFTILTVAPDNRSLTYTQVAPDATVTPAAGTSLGRANIVPANGTIQSAVRTGNVVTLTFAAAVLSPINTPFKVGQGVTVWNGPDLSFNGTFVVLSVSNGNKTLTYAQTGTNASIASGTARMAFPSDLWAAIGSWGGAYYSPNLTARTVWINLYVEGGQRTRFSSSDLLVAPVLPQPPDYDPVAWPETPLQVDASGSGVGLGTVNQPLSVVAPYDATLTSYRRLGATAAQTEIEFWQDPTKTVSDPTATVWKTVRGPNEFAVWHHDPTYGSAVARLRWFGNNATYINSEGGAPVRVNADPNVGLGLLVGDGTGTGPTTAINGGTIAPVPVADATAPNGSIYLGSDHRGALCRKDSTGVTHVVAEVLAGVSSSRSAAPIVGMSYFDTTLGKPVWYNGANWVDSSGAQA